MCSGQASGAHGTGGPPVVHWVVEPRVVVEWLLDDERMTADWRVVLGEAVHHSVLGRRAGLGSTCRTQTEKGTHSKGALGMRVGERWTFRASQDTVMVGGRV